VLVMVVDPGVGSDLREPLLIRYQHLWIVCAGDELLRVFSCRHQTYRAWRIRWQPPGLSKSFHGRDLFAPLAASLSLGEWHEDWLEAIENPTSRYSENPWPEEFKGIVYIDAFGNAVTGMRAAVANHDPERQLRVAETCLPFADVFSSVELGTCFYYVNAVGLLEIAANQASASNLLKLKIGQTVEAE